MSVYSSIFGLKNQQQTSYFAENNSQVRKIKSKHSPSSDKFLVNIGVLCRQYLAQGGNIHVAIFEIKSIHPQASTVVRGETLYDVQPYIICRVAIDTDSGRQGLDTASRLPLLVQNVLACPFSKKEFIDHMECDMAD